MPSTQVGPSSSHPGRALAAVTDPNLVQTYMQWNADIAFQYLLFRELVKAQSSHWGSGLIYPLPVLVFLFSVVWAGPRVLALGPRREPT